MTTRVMSNGTQDASPPAELALRLSQTPGVEINLHLTILSRTIMLFVTSTAANAGHQAVPSMGSFVYALPNRYNVNEPMSTTLYYATSSIDFATRIAKLLARKTGLPCYVGNSISLSNTPGGGSVEQEMEAFKVVVDATMQQIALHKKHAEASLT